MGGELLVIEITTGQPCTADVEFAGNIDRATIAAIAQDPNSQIRKSRPNCHALSMMISQDSQRSEASCRFRHPARMDQ